MFAAGLICLFNKHISCYILIFLIFSADLTSILLKEMFDEQISYCIFESLDDMTKSVMENPDRAVCFQSRFWNVGLIGSVDWASNIVSSSGDNNLYNSVSNLIQESFKLF